MTVSPAFSSAKAVPSARFFQSFIPAAETVFEVDIYIIEDINISAIPEHSCQE